MRKFVLQPLAGTHGAKDINAIEEKQLLYVLKNLLLVRGYECVDSRDDADFVVSIRYSNEYKETYVPPQQITLPRYIPGDTSHTYSTFSGCAGNSLVWGSGTSTTHHPGTWTVDTITVGGYNVGSFYPSLLVVAVDARTFQEVWHGTIVAASRTADIRLTGQFLLADLISHELPMGTRQVDRSRGILGFSAMVYSRDGNTYYPTVVALADKAPAKRAGIKPFDQIVEIDGRDTANITIADFAAMLGNPGDTVRLRIQRGDKFIDKSLVLAERRPEK